MPEPAQPNRPGRAVWDVLLVPTYSGTQLCDWADGKRIELDRDLWVGRVGRALSLATIMDACEPAGYCRDNKENGQKWQPTRQFGTSYAIVCANPFCPNQCNWDLDQRIVHCVALSRLVHPTATGFQYAARLRLGEDGEITHVEPYPRQRAYTVSNNDTSQQRHWLTEEEWAKVSELLKSCPASEKHEQPRIGRALFYFEKTAYEYHFADRWELLVRTAEILWGREFEEDKVVDQGKIKAAGKSSGKRKQGRGARFRIGLRCLANEFNIDVLEEDAEQAWRLRSRVTHGVGLPHPPNVEDPKVQAAEDELAVVDLYLKLEEVLRKTMERAIKDCAFAACFESEKSLDDWLEPER